MFKHNRTTARQSAKRCVFLAAGLLLSNAANAQTEPVRDIFIGMIVEQQGQLILERCDVGSTRYVLHNAVGAGDPLGDLRVLRQGNPQLQAELIASYREDRDGHILDVSAVGETVTGKSCHLIDAVEQMLADKPAPDGKPDVALVGQYYLSGVMETGSELRLKADGRFDWYISYGAVDEVASGRWGRKGKTVTLLADLPFAGTPIFRADERLEWGSDAERFMREKARLKREAAVSALCPWNIASAASAPAFATDDRANPGPAEIAKAEQAKVVGEAARDAATQAAAKAVESDATDAAREAANTAMSAWHNAHYEMEQAYGAADIAIPQIGSPTMPAACELPMEDYWAAIPASDWQGGIAVVVGDPAREMRLSRVGVTFIYDDGHHEAAETGRGGWAFAPLRTGASVVQLALAMPAPVSRSETLAIAPLAKGVQTVHADLQQVIKPPFEVMTLDIKGQDLVPDLMPRGRYSRH